MSHLTTPTATTRIVLSVATPRGADPAFDSVYSALDDAGVVALVTAQTQERAGLERDAGAVLECLRAVTDSADNTGCDGCYVVDASVIDAAQKLVEKHANAPADGVISDPSAKGADQAREQASAPAEETRPDDRQATLLAEHAELLAVLQGVVDAATLGDGTLPGPGGFRTDRLGRPLQLAVETLARIGGVRS